MKTKFCRFTLTVLATVALSGLIQGQDSEVIELDAYVVKAMEDFASRAVENETPVSFSTVDTEQMQFELGSRDLPMVLETTPSVYASQEGGGAGDARVNVRGFDQKNVAVMINGIPVNDMENGWVYWSNWDGVSDASQSIQVQRGMSNVNLATPSIGGTLNIITNPAGQQLGGVIKQEFGSGNFLKTSVTANTGLILNDKFAFTAAVVRKTGDGIIDKTWTDAWAYYIGASWIINDQNRLDFTLLGAPQRHGQNSYEHNLAEYDQDLARKLGADPASFESFPEQGRLWNENWSPMDASYKGKEYYYGDTHSRHSGNFVMERENYFHKPLASLNWALQATDNLSIYSAFYWSGGEGGGSGTYGSTVKFDGSQPGFGYRQFDAYGTYLSNIANEDGRASGILRNSVNEQNTWGAISKITYNMSDEFVLEAGVDWRTAEAAHFREVRDLLGGEFYLESNGVNDHWQNDGGTTKVGLGDKIGYNFENTIDWVGAYVQGQYKNDKWTAFFVTGASNIEYSHTNYFKTTTGLPDGDDLTIDADSIDGYQIKGGIRYNLTEEYSVYFNAGHYDNPPYLDFIIDDGAAELVDDPKNEKFDNFEVGVNYQNKAGTIALNADVYSTTWKDRSITRSVQISQDEYGLAMITGMEQEHRGLEIEGSYMPVKEWRFDVAASLGNWEYTSDVHARVRSNENVDDYYEFDAYIDGLKVGDAPQKQFVLRSTYMPFDGASISLVAKWNGDSYAEFEPEDRNDEFDRTQSWKTPSYWVWDLHLNWNTLIETPWAPLDVTFFIHVFNMWDETYISEATDNDSYNAFDFDHDADDAGVRLGLPRNWNTGFKIRF